MMSDGTMMNVHPLLKDLHKKAQHTEHCCGSGNQFCPQHGKQCHIYASCGAFHFRKDSGKPERLCPSPCAHCLVWEGYGCESDEDVLKVKALMEQHSFK